MFYGHRERAAKKINLDLSYKPQSTEASFFAVWPNVLVTLSGNVAQRLGLMTRIATLNAEDCQDCTKGFEDVFQGLGVLKGVT